MPSNFRFGRFELRPRERALLEDGKALRLGGRAFDILLALVERRDRVVEFDELLDVVWPGLAVEENNLSVQISTLRKLLDASAITTVRGKGYRFTAPTRELAIDDSSIGGPALPPAMLRKWGAVVVVLEARTAAGAWTDRTATELAPVAGACVVQRFENGVALAFDQADVAARAAVKLMRQGVRQCGVVAADMGAEQAPVLTQAVWRAHALAGLAGRCELVVTAELASEFVPGVDGEVEDLGDLSLPSGSVRAFAVRLAPVAAGLVVPAGPNVAGVRPSIAILPFESQAAAEQDDLLGEALSDDVINCLAGSPEFDVISGLSSRRLKRCGLPVASMARHLCATYLLSGSYRSAAGRIVLNAQLQDVRSGAVLHTMHLDLGLAQAFDPHERVGRQIAREVVEAVFAHAMLRSRLQPFPELENYALLMGAIGLMHRAALQEFERAGVMLEHLAQRPGCRGVAAAWLAKWHVLRVVQGWSVDASADARIALDCMTRSLDDDSRDALALSIGGLVHAYLRKDLATAGQLYEAAIDANPSEPLAWLFTATRHAYLGEGAAAEAAGERALQLSPIDPLKYFFDSLAATAALANSSWARSVALCQRSLKANRTHASTWRTMAFALVMLDRMDEARQAVQRLQAVEPAFTVGRFLERFPGRDGPLAQPWAEALSAAGLPH